MNVPDVYNYKDYKKFLVDLVKANKAQRGFQARISSDIGCQPATFSRAIKGKIELTRDQIANLCAALRLGEMEADFVLNLFDAELSGSTYLRGEAARKNEIIRNEIFRLSAQLKETSEKLSDKYVMRYYSSWMYSAIYMLLMVPKYQTIMALLKRLKLGEDVLAKVLKELIGWGLVKKTPSGFEAIEKSIHLDKDSPLSKVDHLNWRLKALEDIQQESSESLHYSSIFSMSEEDFLSLKKIIISDIKKYRERAIKSKSEDVFVLNLDFFQI